jgi:hypothetical protein
MAASSGTVAVARESGSQVAQPPSPASGSYPALAPSPSSSAVKVAEVPVVSRKLWKVLVPAAVVLVAALIAGGLYWRSRSPLSVANATHLTENDTVVLADFTNSAGDPVFDGTRENRLPGFLLPLERRRPRHSHPEKSQSGIRETAIVAVRQQTNNFLAAVKRRLH